jgi:hypothetical protein
MHRPHPDSFLGSANTRALPENLQMQAVMSSSIRFLLVSFGGSAEWRPTTLLEGETIR